MFTFRRLARHSLTASEGFPILFSLPFLDFIINDLSEMVTDEKQQQDTKCSQERIQTSHSQLHFRDIDESSNNYQEDYRFFPINLFHACKDTTIRRQHKIKNKKNRMSPDNRFPKTNYLKTNLLKQIKKNIFVGIQTDFFLIHAAKLQKKQISCKQFC